jgi:hypothetical protein
MKTYAYKLYPICSFLNETLEEELNALGAEGWRVVAQGEFKEGNKYLVMERDSEFDMLAVEGRL